MIRIAVHTDVDRLVELGRSMWEESPTYSAYDFNESKLRIWLELVIDNQNGVILVYERDKQIIGGMVGWHEEQFFGHDRVLCDLALFVEPGKRGSMAGAALIKAYVEYGRDLGVAQIVLSNSSGVNRDRIARLYERLGMKHCGYVYAFNNKGA